MSIFTKVIQAGEAYLDNVIEKARKEPSSGTIQDEYAERKSAVELLYPEEQQYGWKEKTGLVGPGVLKNMARKDSIVAAIINTRLSQIMPFTKLQKDRYSPGWNIFPKKPADVTEEEKLELADPALDDETRKIKKQELDEKRQKIKAKQDKDIAEMVEFVKHCGMPPEETDTTYRRWDFTKFVKIAVQDRLIYNYSATELIPTKDGDKLHHFYPVSSGTIKYVSVNSSEQFEKMLAPILEERSKLKKRFDPNKPFRYVQIVRGKIVAAFTEDELIFEPSTPTVDPEDNGYAMGELEMLIQIVTAHLYAEAHNRNFFTQGIGTKGILHIKGDNISRAQLEAFKRQWFNQVINSRNAFRPPVIGMAEDVKWVELAQSNKDMEFDNWMNYLIKIACAIYQIDPAEINFDISKVQTSSLQEANNEEKLRASKDKGLLPLLDYIETIVNDHIIRYWDPKLANDYEFKFVGFQAESRKAEGDRLQKETQTWKTLNEARIEMGLPPIEDGDIVLNATYTQYKAQKLQQEQAAQMPQEGDLQDEEMAQQNDAETAGDFQELEQELMASLDEGNSEMEKEERDAKEKAKSEEAKKSEEVTPTIVEYYLDKDDVTNED